MTGTQTPAELSAGALIESVSRRAGSDDWGEGPFADALGLLLSCAEGETLSDVGRRVLHSVAVRHLRNRLAVGAFVCRHPEARQGALGRSIVVTGLPRTATTALHELLALDPANRPLRLWEALRPVPATGDQDRMARVTEAEEWLARFYEAVPGFKVVHPLHADGPEECDALLQNSFTSQHFDDMFDAPAYSEWLAHAPLAGEYGHYALQLRVLASGDDAPRRWVLKSPIHVGHLDALLAALPGALVVHCHRDPVQAVSSYASLIATLRGAYAATVDRHRIGAQSLRRCATAIGRALAVREAATTGDFIDVAHDQVVRDPMSAVRVVYGAAGATLEEPVERHMEAWVRHNPKGSHGEHRYSAAEFGIDESEVAASFAAYTDRFGAFVRWTSP